MARKRHPGVGPVSKEDPRFERWFGTSKAIYGRRELFQEKEADLSRKVRGLIARGRIRSADEAARYVGIQTKHAHSKTARSHKDARLSDFLMEEGAYDWEYDDYDFIDDYTDADYEEKSA